MNTLAETNAGPEPPETGRRETQSNSGRVFLQLFVIPLVLVTIAVGIALLFSRLAHVSTTPTDLVEDIQQMGVDRWQKAHTLSALLRDPRNDSLKDDSLLCQQLAKVLSMETTAASDDVDRVRLRVFLCRILGEFRILDGLPALTDAAAPSSYSFDADARLAAIEAIAVLAGNLGADAVTSQPSVMEVLLAASRESGDYGINQERVELRSTAAFALGVVGGPEATNQLAAMLADAHSNVRFNAAAGLARHADHRAIPVLLEMLDPANPEAVPDEITSTPRKVKRSVVLLTGIRATEQLATAMNSSTTGPLVNALRRLSTDQRVKRHVRMDAKETMLRIKSDSPSRQAGWGLLLHNVFLAKELRRIVKSKWRCPISALPYLRTAVLGGNGSASVRVQVNAKHWHRQCHAGRFRPAIPLQAHLWPLAGHSRL